MNKNKIKLYEIKGMNSDQIVKLLGEPTAVLNKADDLFGKYHDFEKEGVDMYYYYRIRDDVVSGWKIFLIGFKENIVIGSDEGIEDW
ncbi:MAG: hypothetical protein PHX08_22620 [Lachnospiraceae bacterium]|nr:hypothetical protein [Lachnospiraceae bacterium]